LINLYLSDETKQNDITKFINIIMEHVQSYISQNKMEMVDIFKSMAIDDEL